MLSCPASRVGRHRGRLPQPDGALPHSRVLGLTLAVTAGRYADEVAAGLVAIVLGSLFSDTGLIQARRQLREECQDVTPMQLAANELAMMNPVIVIVRRGEVDDSGRRSTAAARKQPMGKPPRLRCVRALHTTSPALATPRYARRRTSRPAPVERGECPCSRPCACFPGYYRKL